MFVPLLSTADRVLVAVLTLGWLGCLGSFWLWWLTPAHRAGWPGLVLNTLLLFYLSVQPAFFFLSANRLRRVDPDVELPRLRIAMVVTRAPSEPWPVAQATLIAMFGQHVPYRYHVWLCDEDPTPEILDWCAQYGVLVSTRRDAPDYHRSSWPRRTRCKEGNLAYFYDTWGYSYYDVVSQFDCDHVPEPTYLAEMIRPFADPAVGYVAAPSICDANAAGSWSGRSRLYREAGFQGPFQAGHVGGLAPTCIGSHYAVRTEALREIGGIGPELAEDFSTAFLLTSAGWEGAFALNAEAHGDGPPTFAAMVTQEFQWSRSLATLLYDLCPRHFGRMLWRLRLRFLQSLLYYPLLVVSAVVGTSLAPIAAVTGVPWVNVSYLGFLTRWAMVAVWPLLLLLLLRRRRLLRPYQSPVISWEVWLSSFTRWPFVVWGVTAATLQKLWPRPVGFKVTPKGGTGLESLPTRLVLPFVALATLLSAAAAIGGPQHHVPGYVLLCLLIATGYTFAATAICLLHAAETGRVAGVAFGAALRATALAPLLAVLATTPLLVLAYLSFPIDSLGVLR